jgi:predicted amidohydrolase
MANFVKISTVGATPLSGGKELNNQQALDKTRAYWRRELDQVLPDRPDLIVLPEACDRYQDVTGERRQDYYRFRGDQMRDFFAEIADRNNCYIAYSAAREMADNTWRNATEIIDRAGGTAGTYNKNHLVIEETTNGGILCGKDAPLIECDFGSVACAICFDLNFDELRLKYVEKHPDLILFSSMYHGGLMQNYWAYSCRSHFVSAIAPAACASGILSPVGETLASSTNYFDYVSATVNLDCAVAHLDYNWERFEAMRKKYGRAALVSDPGYLGAVLISSEHAEVSIQDMVQEFGIELLDAYMARALNHRRNNTED